VFEFGFQFDVHRFDSLLAEVLSYHCTSDLRYFSVPLTRCIRKGCEKLFFGLVCSVDLFDDLPSRLEVFEDVSCVLELTRETLADRSKPGFDAE